MNCKGFRRRLLEEPASKQADFQAHRQACAECAEAWRLAQAFESRLKAALREPLEKGAWPVTPRGGTAPVGRRSFAILGGVAALLLVALGLFQVSWRGGTLEGLVVEHIRAEPELLARERAIDPLEVSRVMEAGHWAMRHLPAATVAVAPCWIRTGRGVHLVLRGREGPVSVLIMPAEFLAATRPFGDRRSPGLLMPAVRGSVALVAASQADLEESVGYLRANLLWRGRPAILAF